MLVIPISISGSSGDLSLRVPIVAVRSHSPQDRDTRSFFKAKDKHMDVETRAGGGYVVRGTFTRLVEMQAALEALVGVPFAPGDWVTCMAVEGWHHLLHSGGVQESLPHLVRRVSEFGAQRHGSVAGEPMEARGWITVVVQEMAVCEHVREVLVTPRFGDCAS